MAPSRYEYRSEAEWQQALAEWCDENEPQHIINARSSEDEPFRKVYLTKPEMEARRAGYTSTMKKSYIPPTAHPQGGYADHLPGGSRADYRMAGFRRY